MSDYTRIGSFYPGNRFAPGIQAKAGMYSNRKKSYYFVKRGFDVVVSLLLVVVVLSWLVPVIALIIKLDSGGALFFRQKRVGKDGHYFMCYKFRTMRINDEADTKQAAENDPRITRAGKWLRRSNIDELPQLINVLAGEMSLVGPRPHMPADCTRFAGLVADYAFRHRVKPGITGLAQVKGYHGPTPDYESIFGRYKWDAFYVRNTSIWLDIRIMISTVTRRITL
jgi:putative colanic acid biosynthesis UDP-glucose lipid carrier transferase